MIPLSDHKSVGKIFLQFFLFPLKIFQERIFEDLSRLNAYDKLKCEMNKKIKDPKRYTALSMEEG